MRAPKQGQSPFSAPLNGILGAEANVRILRELCLAGVALPRSVLAERAGLTIAGTSKAVAKLQRSGVVVPVGAGARQSVRLRKEHPLSFALRMLFLSEASRAEALLDDVRSALSEVSPPPLAAWGDLEAAGQPDAPLMLGVLAVARDVPQTITSVRRALVGVQRAHGIPVEFRVVTDADLLTAEPAELDRLHGVTPLFGPHPLELLDVSAPPEEFAKTMTHPTHRLREHEAALVAAWLADRLDGDPTLPRRAHRWLVHRSHVASDREQHELDEWLDVLQHSSIPHIKRLLLDPGERATRLRQSNPFVPVLSREERDRMREEIGR